MNLVSREEKRRLARLHEYEILDSVPEAGFDRITRLAARIFSVSMAAVSLVDADRQWHKASHGLNRGECPRGLSFCAHVIASDAVMVVPDTEADARFASHAFVIGEPHIRFYAGAPLLVDGGCRLGALCVMDCGPRDFSTADAAALVDLAALVVDELDLRSLAGHLHAEVLGGHRTQTALRKQREVLRRQRQTLAGRVERRSAELMRANRSLRAEVARREKGEAALHHAKEEAENANRAKSEFLSRMSHELRTPLNAILGFGQILQAQVPSDAHRDCTTHIVNAGRHLLGLINEVLDISRIEAGRVELVLERVRMAEAVGETLDLIRPLAGEHGIVVELEPKSCVSEVVIADRQRLKQVLLNLLSNAVKFSPAGSRVTVVCQTARPRQVRLCVRDAGPGIAPEELGRLFVPFDRLGAERLGVAGTGLGLALSKHLTEAMKGTIGVTSVLGEGSTFWVQLPLAESAEFPARPRRVRPPNGQGATPGGGQSHDKGYTYSNGNGHRYALSNSQGTAQNAVVAPDETRTLLYIEDNASNVSLVEHLLEDWPRTRLLTARRGLEGLRLARAHLPDLILLDLHLPDLDGWKVLGRLRRLESTRRIPVVAVSADASRDTIDRVLQAGGRAYLTKPLNIDHFRHLLHTLGFTAPLSAEAVGTV